MDTCQGAPVEVGAPRGCGFVASRDDDQAACRELREQRVAEPLVERRQPLVGVDEQHAAGRPPFQHRAHVAMGGADRLAEGDEKSQRRGFDVAAIDAHHVAAGLVGHARVLVEQRRLSHPAGSRDVQRHEGRVAGLQRRPEDRDLLLASDETLSASRRESFGNPCKVGGGDGDRRDDPVPPLGNRLDVLRGPLVVAERTPQVGNRAGQRRLRDEAAFPHPVDDLVFRDHAARAAGKKHQQVHDLRLETTHRPVVADEVAGGLREPPADVEVRSGRRTSLPTGHPRIVDVVARSRTIVSAGRRWPGPAAPPVAAAYPDHRARPSSRRSCRSRIGRSESPACGCSCRSAACPCSRPCRSRSRCSG